MGDLGGVIVKADFNLLGVGSNLSLRSGGVRECGLIRICKTNQLDVGSGDKFVLSAEVRVARAGAERVGQCRRVQRGGLGVSI